MNARDVGALRGVRIFTRENIRIIFSSEFLRVRLKWGAAAAAATAGKSVHRLSATSSRAHVKASAVSERESHVIPLRISTFFRAVAFLNSYHVLRLIVETICKTIAANVASYHSCRRIIREFFYKRRRISSHGGCL